MLCNLVLGDENGIQLYIINTKKRKPKENTIEVKRNEKEGRNRKTETQKFPRGYCNLGKECLYISNRKTVFRDNSCLKQISVE